MRRLCLQNGPLFGHGKLWKGNYEHEWVVVSEIMSLCHDLTTAEVFPERRHVWAQPIAQPKENWIDCPAPRSELSVDATSSWPQNETDDSLLLYLSSPDVNPLSDCLFVCGWRLWLIFILFCSFSSSLTSENRRGAIWDGNSFKRRLSGRLAISPACRRRSTDRLRAGIIWKLAVALQFGDFNIQEMIIRYLLNYI